MEVASHGRPRVQLRLAARVALARDVPLPDATRVFAQDDGAEGDPDLDRPHGCGVVDVAGGLEGAVPELAGHQPVVGAEQVQDCPARVDHDLVIVATIVTGVEEDLDAVILPHRAIAPRGLGLQIGDVRLIALDADVRRLVIKDNLEARLGARRR